MSIDYNVLPLKKGKTRKQLKAKKDREDAKQLKAFRDAVWKLIADRHFNDGTDLPAEEITIAVCEYCGRYVNRAEGFPLTGEVHHRKSRRHKETRYDPDNGVLLCNHLVNNCHEKAERKLITV